MQNYPYTEQLLNARSDCLSDGVFLTKDEFISLHMFCNNYDQYQFFTY